MEDGEIKIKSLDQIQVIKPNVFFYQSAASPSLLTRLEFAAVGSGLVWWLVCEKCLLDAVGASLHVKL